MSLRTQAQDITSNLVLKEKVRPQEGEIPTFIFSSPEIYELEMERLFPRCWLLVAHASEIPESGDYVTRSLGQLPVIVVRGGDGKIRILLNVCRHRGMRVCRADLGNSDHFECPYHGYTYKSTGELIGVPFQKDSYGELDKSRFGLIEMRVDTHQGLVFGAVPDHKESLDQYLGNMKWYLDLFLKRADMVVAGPPQRWVVRTNWKVPAENFASDAYHTAQTHASIPALGLTPSLSWAKAGYHVNAGNGHGLGIGTGAPGSPSIWPEELLPVFQKNLVPGQLAILKELKNCHATVFPNLSLLISSIIYEERPVYMTTMRLWQPRGSEAIEVISWLLVEKETSDEWKKKIQKTYILTFGSSGMLEQDDTENWTKVTENSRQLGRLLGMPLSYGMGLGRKPMENFPGPGEVFEGKFHEANARAFYQRWLDLLVSAGA
jgi:nitrite reductase/ring-hydroxylating ferredoxin subunit